VSLALQKRSRLYSQAEEKDFKELENDEEWIHLLLDGLWFLQAFRIELDNSISEDAQIHYKRRIFIAFPANHSLASFEARSFTIQTTSRSPAFILKPTRPAG